MSTEGSISSITSYISEYILLNRYSNCSINLKMKFLLVIAVVLVAAQASSMQEQWKEFKLSHGKTYKSLLEDKRRFAIFQDKVRQFKEHNARYARGAVSYSVGVNQFADWTEQEIEDYLTPIKLRPQMKFVGVHNATMLDLGAESVNWVTKGYVTPVKNQKNCGSCWAFSAVGAIEGQVAKNGGGLVSLSVQNLVDCSYYNNACRGGYLFRAFEYAQEKGILADTEYPYTASRGQCLKSGGQKISGYVEVAKTEAALLHALSTVGPIAVGINANKLSPYSGGIFDNSSGCTTYINHDVLVVGAGTENGKDYWLIKNSWGESWGLEGYFKLARGQNACGINLQNYYPTL